MFMLQFKALVQNIANYVDKLIITSKRCIFNLTRLAIAVFQPEWMIESNQITEFCCKGFFIVLRIPLHL